MTSGGRERSRLRGGVRAGWLASSLALAAPVQLLLAAGAERDAASSASSDAVLRESAAMVDAGLAFLARHQNEDRSFTIVPGEEARRAPLAVTALSALAFMANGSTLGRGPYRDQVRGAIEYLLDHQVRHGTPDAGLYGYFKVEGDDTSRSHGHGFATLAVAEAYGTMSVDRSYGEAAQDKLRKDQERMHDALVAAVRLIERSQSREGGWEYDFDGKNHEGSVTITLIQAMRAARNAGIDVDRGVVDAAVRYVHDSQHPQSGGFRYRLNESQITYALTAAAIATLNAAGDYDSHVIDLGIEYMKRHDPVLNPTARLTEQYPFYTRLYAAQAYFEYRDPRLWERWHPVVVRELANSRIQSNGGFTGGEYGQVYATAMACLVLSVPFQVLPIFQR